VEALAGSVLDLLQHGPDAMRVFAIYAKIRVDVWLVEQLPHAGQPGVRGLGRSWELWVWGS
jgi:hypothetical protein